MLYMGRGIAAVLLERQIGTGFHCEPAYYDSRDGPINCAVADVLVNRRFLMTTRRFKPRLPSFVLWPLDDLALLGSPGHRLVIHGTLPVALQLCAGDVRDGGLLATEWRGCGDESLNQRFESICLMKHLIIFSEYPPAPAVALARTFGIWRGSWRIAVRPYTSSGSYGRR